MKSQMLQIEGIEYISPQQDLKIARTNMSISTNNLSRELGLEAYKMMQGRVPEVCIFIEESLDYTNSEQNLISRSLHLNVKNSTTNIYRVSIYSFFGNATICVFLKDIFRCNSLPTSPLKCLSSSGWTYERTKRGQPKHSIHYYNVDGPKWLHRYSVKAN